MQINYSKYTISSQSRQIEFAQGPPGRYWTGLIASEMWGILSPRDFPINQHHSLDAPLSVYTEEALMFRTNPDLLPIGDELNLTLFIGSEY